MSYTTYLAHHGIKGQKWGVRRFQSYDGTRIKNESTQKIKIPKGPYYKWGKERGIRVYNRTKAGNKLFEVMHSTASDVINKLNEDGQMTKTYQDVCKAGWAFTGGVKFNDIRDEYVHAYYDKMERDSTYDYRKCYNSTYDSFQEPNISDKSAFVKILHDDVGKVVTKDVWKEDPNMPSWKESPFYKAQNTNPDSTEVQSAYADILKNGKILYEKENRLISLIKKENSRNRLSNDEEQECQGLLNDLGYSHGDGRSDFVRPEHSDEWRKHMRDKAYDPGLSEERLFYRIQDPEEVSHAVITNYDIPSYENYLAHHGIKGQKWGVRRFQKTDGSLTAAGAKRYGIKSAMSAGRKVGSGLVKAARGGIQKAKEVKARKAAEKLERQKKVWAKTRLGLTMNADKFSIEELREANNRLDERDRAARGLAEQVKRGVGYFQAIRDVTGAIKDTKDYIEDISGEKGKKAKAADELKYQRELEKEKRTYERDMVRDKVKADQEYEYKREKDRLDRESKEKIEKMKAKAKKKKDSSGSDQDPEPDDIPKKKASRENTTEFEDVYWNSPKKDREFMETLFPKEVDEAKERKKRRNKARREVDEAIRRMGFFGHSDISTYGAYLAHHGIKGQKWGVRRFQNEDGTLTKAGMKRAGYKFKTLRKNATASRVLIDENEDTLNLDRAYFSTNNLDNQKWANYFASIGAQHLDKSAFAVNFKTKKKLLIARGEEISKVASKLMAEDDTFRKEFEATRQKQIRSTGSDEAWESLSESAKYSAMIAYKCEGGKKIVNAMKEIGFDGVEDLFGKDVSKDPIIIFDPGSNLRQVGKKQELKGLYRGYRQYYGLPINHSSFSLHSISDSMSTFADDDLSAYGTYLAHHGIKGQKWGVRRFQNYDGTRISSRIRSGIQARRYSAELNKLERKKKKSVDRMLQEYNKIRGLMNEAKKYSTTKPMRALKLLDKGEARLDKFAQMQAEDEKFEDEIIKKQKVILSELKKNGFEYTAPAYRVKVGSDKSIRFA